MFQGRQTRTKEMESLSLGSWHLGGGSQPIDMKIKSIIRCVMRHSVLWAKVHQERGWWGRQFEIGRLKRGLLTCDHGLRAARQ